MRYANFGYNTAKELPMTSMVPLGNTILQRKLNIIFICCQGNGLYYIFNVYY